MPRFSLCGALEAGLHGREPARQDYFDRLAGESVTPVAEQPLGLMVRALDATVGTNAHHRVGDSVEKRLERDVGALSHAIGPRARGSERGLDASFALSARCSNWC